MMSAEMVAMLKPPPWCGKGVYTWASGVVLFSLPCVFLCSLWQTQAAKVLNCDGLTVALAVIVVSAA